MSEIYFQYVSILNCCNSLLCRPSFPAAMLGSNRCEKISESRKEPVSTIYKPWQTILETRDLSPLQPGSRSLIKAEKSKPKQIGLGLEYKKNNWKKRSKCLILFLFWIKLLRWCLLEASLWDTSNEYNTYNSAYENMVLTAYIQCPR